MIGTVLSLWSRSSRLLSFARSALSRRTLPSTSILSTGKLLLHGPLVESRVWITFAMDQPGCESWDSSTVDALICTNAPAIPLLFVTTNQ